MDDPGISAGAGYLATFTYRASADARGVFVIDLLHDWSDPAQRTYLFNTTPEAVVDIVARSIRVGVTRHASRGRTR